MHLLVHKAVVSALSEEQKLKRTIQFDDVIMPNNSDTKDITANGKKSNGKKSNGKKSILKSARTAEDDTVATAPVVPQPIIPVENLEITQDSVTDDLKDFNTFTLGDDEDLVPNAADAIAAALELETSSDEEA